MSGPRQKAAVAYGFFDVRGFLQTRVAKCATGEVGSRIPIKPLFYKAFSPHAARAGRGARGPRIRPVPLCPLRCSSGIRLGAKVTPPRLDRAGRRLWPKSL
jgi:hypothetical protein